MPIKIAAPIFLTNFIDPLIEGYYASETHALTGISRKGEKLFFEQKEVVLYGSSGPRRVFITIAIWVKRPMS